MYTLIRPLLFTLDPEKAHYITFDLLKTFKNVPGSSFFLQSVFDRTLLHDGIDKWGLHFKNKIGLAAGLDKDARWVDELADLGFGFIEIGTLTPKAQPGNPKPRLFRIPEDKAVINRMGFNNQGVIEASQRLALRKRKDVIVGGNIGKNKLTPNDEAVNDYVYCFDALKNHVDYFVVNVSSPNTPGLRELQEKGPLLEILNAIQLRNHDLNSPKPLLIKIAPDLTISQLDDIVEIAIKSGLNGVIATNTTISRDKLTISPERIEKIGAGGLSGAPLSQTSDHVLEYLSKRAEGRFDLIGVGGIMNGENALNKIKSGAALVQLYSGLIYKGPSLVSEVLKSIRNA